MRGTGSECVVERIFVPVGALENDADGRRDGERLVVRDGCVVRAVGEDHFHGGVPLEVEAKLKPASGGRIVGLCRECRLVVVKGLGNVGGMVFKDIAEKFFLVSVTRTAVVVAAGADVRQCTAVAVAQHRLAE